MRIVVALGSNLGERETALSRAISLMEEEVGQILAHSTVIETEPLNHPSNHHLVQPRYLNAAVLLDTILQPESVLDSLLSIERQIGRNREGELRWGPRVIDLDLVCYENLVLGSESLYIPHREMHKRDFVLLPMQEVWPDWVHPIFGLKVAEMIAKLGQS